MKHYTYLTSYYVYFVRVNHLLFALNRNNFIKDYLETIGKFPLTYLILVRKKPMPADKYAFRASLESMTLAENFNATLDIAIRLA